jgi:hypothetical protein
MWPWPWCLTYLLKTLTLAITFKWYVVECWYFTWVFLVTRSFHGYQNFWPCDLDLNVWLIKNFNLGYNFQMVCTRTDISHECTLRQNLFMGTKIFDLVTLTLVFDLLIKNFNLGYNIWMVSTRALIFHMSVPCERPFHGYQQIWPCDLDLGVWPTCWKL